MANNCDTSVVHDFLYDCENPPAAGLEKEMLLINFYDIDRSKSALDETNPIILKTLVLKEGKKANIIEQRKTSFSGTGVANAEGTYQNGFTHTVAFVAFDNSAESKQAQTNMVNGKFVAVIKNTSAPDNARYEIYGYYTGLSTPTMSQDKVASESSGCAAWTIASGMEPTMPLSFYDTSIETTETAYEALKTAAPGA